MPFFERLRHWYRRCEPAQPSEESRTLPRARMHDRGEIMRVSVATANQNRRIVASLPFVEALARRMAASMPNSIEIRDLVQDGVLGLIDAAHRFDEDRGIK